MSSTCSSPTRIIIFFFAGSHNHWLSLQNRVDIYIEAACMRVGRGQRRRREMDWASAQSPSGKPLKLASLTFLKDGPDPNMPCLSKIPRNVLRSPPASPRHVIYHHRLDPSVHYISSEIDGSIAKGGKETSRNKLRFLAADR